MTAPRPCRATSAAGHPCSRPTRSDGWCWQHIPTVLPAPITDESGAAVITAKCGTTFRVDLADYEDVASHRWTLDKMGYPRRWVLLSDRKPRSISIQRHILGLAAGNPLCADHINADILDNRRSNLRAVTRAENAQNVRASRGHRGVFRHRARWRAEATVNQVTYRIGSYATELEAAEAVHHWRLQNMPGYVDRPAARRTA